MGEMSDKSIAFSKKSPFHSYQGGDCSKLRERYGTFIHEEPDHRFEDFDEAKWLAKSQVSDVGPGRARTADIEGQWRKMGGAPSAPDEQAVGGDQGFLETQLVYDRNNGPLGLPASIEDRSHRAVIKGMKINTGRADIAMT